MIKLLFTLLLFSTIIGETFKFFIFGIKISPVDISLFLLISAFFLEVFLRKRTLNFYKGFGALTLFFVIGFLSNFYNIFDLNLNFSESFQGFLYFFRYLFFSFLILLGFSLSKNEKTFFIKSILFSGFFLAILGFLQLKFFPNFELLEMNKFGWDPHIGRLFSTWFDPNLFGGFLVFLSIFFTGFLLENFKKGNKLLNYFIFFALILFFISIFLTFSRSALLAFGVGFFLFFLIFSRKLLLIFLIIFFLGIFSTERGQKRFFDGVNSGKQIFLGTGKIDETSNLRVQSWKAGINIFKENKFIGVGFNNLKSVQKKNWSFIGDKNGASGIDSSILTVFACVGIFGGIFFLYFLGKMFFQTFKNFRKTKNLEYLGIFCGIFSIFIHSIFVNSLFFYLFLPYFFILIGIYLKKET